MALHNSVFGKVSGIRFFKRYLKDTGATVTQIFALSAIPFFLAAGAAIDGARINDEHAKFMAAVDSAVIAVAADDRAAITGLEGTELTDRMTLLEDLAAKYVEENYGGDGDIGVDLTVTGQSVKLDASIEFPTTIMSLVGITDIDLDASSTVKKAMRPIEIALVMDTTGSMSSSGKLSGAKTAAHELLETLYAGTETEVPRSEFIRVSFVPFAAAVRLDKNAHDFDLSWIDTNGDNPLSKLNFDAVSGTPSAWNNYYAWSQIKKSSTEYHEWNGCVEARDSSGSSPTFSAYNTSDTPPTSSDPASLFPAYFLPDAPYGGYSSRRGWTSSNNYGMGYISGTSTTDAGNECLGLTDTECESSDDEDRLKRQENYRKYIDKNLGAESTSTDGPWSLCAATPIVPMTHDRGKIEDAIDAMTADGNTVIPEGVAWGWRTLSPGEPFTKVEGSGGIAASTISPYNDARWQKIMVIMTDGDNNVSGGNYSLNSSLYSAYGFGGVDTADNRFNSNTWGSEETQIDADMAALCTSVKEKKIPIYVAAFGTGISTTTKNKLKACSSGTEYYAEATSSADLVAFFNHIGEDVINKSIYVAK
jgi:hypothetical protein